MVPLQSNHASTVKHYKTQFSAVGHLFPQISVQNTSSIYYERQYTNLVLRRIATAVMKSSRMVPNKAVALSTPFLQIWLKKSESEKVHLNSS